MRFLGLGLTDRVPDAKTIWAFRERLTRAEKWHQSVPGSMGQAPLCGQGAATVSPAAVSRSRASMIRA